MPFYILESQMKNLTPILLLLITFYSFCLSAHASQSRERHQSPSNITELKVALADLMQHYKVPAAGIAMIDKQGLVYFDAIGLANREENISVNTDSLFRLGSTSKMLVALSVLKLVEDDKLSLQDKLVDLAPEIEFDNPYAATYPIKIVHLLEHTTGWDEQHYPEFAHNQTPPISLKDGLDFHPHSRASRWHPGSRYAYNNTGPAVAAYIVEKVSGKTFEAFVQMHFFNMLDMQHSTFLYDEVFTSMPTVGYDDKNRPLNYHHFINRPASALNSSIKDMTNLLTLFIQRGQFNGTQVLSEQSLVRMETPKSSLSAQKGMQTGYGLSNYSEGYNQWVYREHRGGIEGYMSEISYIPEQQTGHVILLNTKNIAAFQKISNLIKDYETQQLNQSATAPAAVLLMNQKTNGLGEEFLASPQTKAAIEGLYYEINPRVELFSFINYISNMKTFSFEGNTLIQGKAVGASKNYYHPVSDDLYRSNETGLISLAKVTDPIEGEVLHYAYGASAVKTSVLKKINPWLGYTQLLMGFLWLLIIVFSLFKTLGIGIAKFRGRDVPIEVKQLRRWPLMSSWAFISVWGLLFVAGSNPYYYMAEPTIVSVGIMLMTIVFALCSVFAVVTVVIKKSNKVNKSSYWYYAIASGLHFCVMLFLLKFGVIGIIFWA